MDNFTAKSFFEIMCFKNLFFLFTGSMDFSIMKNLIGKFVYFRLRFRVQKLFEKGI